MKPAIKRGEKCYNARLTEEQVRLARIYVMQGPVGVLPQLARKWGVGTQTLRNAVIYKNWKHIPPPTAEEIAATPLPSWVETVGETAASTLRAMRPLGPHPWLHYGDT
jgi:hypothetical protein